MPSIPQQSNPGLLHRSTRSKRRGRLDCGSRLSYSNIGGTTRAGRDVAYDNFQLQAPIPRLQVAILGVAVDLGHGSCELEVGVDVGGPVPDEVNHA
jgi:hypothetical protein